MLTLSKLIQATKPIFNPRIAASVQFQTTAFNQATLEERLGLPPRPKRPLTPYFRFMKEMRPIVVEQNPNKQPLEIVKILAEKYKSIDPALMNRFEHEFRKDQEEYLKKKSVYEQKLTPEQKQNLIDAKEAQIERKEKLAYKKRCREANKPKRPPTAFLRFIHDVKDKIPRDTSKPYVEFQKLLAQKWNALSEQEKRVYLDAAVADFAKYKQELSKWELKMVRLAEQGDDRVAAESKTSSEKSLNKDKWMDTTKIEKAAVKNQQQKSMDEDVKITTNITSSIIWQGLFEDILDLSSWEELLDIAKDNQ